VTVLASLHGVTKTYRLGTERSNWRALIPGRLGEPRGQHFNALEGIDLEIRAGASIGIVGENGAGKSTLLKVIAGIVKPTSGTVSVSGRVAAAIELGVGFNADLTGAENLQFAGALFGATAHDINRRRDEIVDFSGLANFMDMPVKRYSTGMRARLGFALVTAFEADLVILDEVLSVGDWAFQQKCLRRIDQLHQAGAAVVAVSHSNWLITQISDHAVLLESGRIVLEGDPLTVIERYLGEDTITDQTKDRRFPTLPVLDSARHDSAVRIHGLTVEPAGIQPNDPLRVHCEVEVDAPVEGELVMSIYTMGRAVFADPNIGPSQILRQPGRWRVAVTTDRLPFSPGAFKVRLAAVTNVDPEDHLQEHVSALASASAPFKVLGQPASRPGLLFDTNWEVEPLADGGPTQPATSVSEPDGIER
jgi:ABC-type polysaccharide/polyol phosphate transport system ATPase subunit